MKRVIYASAAILTLLMSFGFQSGKDEPPGGISLLPGYRFEPASEYHPTGIITKEGGITIYCDVPTHYWHTISTHNRYLWFKEKVVNQQPVQIALTKNGRTLLVYFPNPKQAAMFSAEVKTEEDIVDVLLMVLTYNAK